MKTWKAGGIPYYLDEEGKLNLLLITSTNPMFGGPYPSIAKGQPDKGENFSQTAFREMHEETGVQASDIKSSKLLGTVKNRSYILYVMAYGLYTKVEPIPNWEAVGHWYTVAEAREVIRQDHKVMLPLLEEAVKSL